MTRPHVTDVWTDRYRLDSRPRMQPSSSSVGNFLRVSSAAEMSTLICFLVIAATIHVVFSTDTSFLNEHRNISTIGHVSIDVGFLGGFPKIGKHKPSIKVETLPTTSANHIFVGPILIGQAPATKPNSKQTVPPGTDVASTKAFKMMFDTVTSDMIVMGEGLSNEDYHPPPGCRYAPTHPTYYTYYDHPIDSTTIEEQPPHLDLQSPDGSHYEGELVKDTVQIGRVVLEDVEFTVVDYMNSAAVCLRGSDYDGTIGLDRNALTRTGASSVFGKMIETKKSLKKAPMFSFYISPDGRNGEVLFGRIDKKLHQGRMKFFPIVEKDNNGVDMFDWRLKFDGIKIGSETCVHAFVARFESTFKYGIYSANTRDVSTAIMKKVPGAQRLDETNYGRVVIDCDQRKELLPDLTLMIGGTELSFTGEEYFIPFRRAEQGGKKKEKQDQRDLCELFVVESSDGVVPDDGLFALGVPFMTKYYTAFDTAGQIGIARSKAKQPAPYSSVKKKKKERKVWPFVHFK